MFDRVRSDGGSSGEGVGARRRSATVSLGRKGGYTLRRNRAMGCRITMAPSPKREREHVAPRQLYTIL
ncbi:hypothetical protein S83_063859 [Arachis hypogaea]